MKTNSILPRRPAPFGGGPCLRRSIIPGIIAALILTVASDTRAAEPLFSLYTETASFGIDAHGSVSLISRHENNRNYVASNQPAPLLSLRVDGKYLAPRTAAWDGEHNNLTLHYGSNEPVAELHLRTRPTHVVFELEDIKEVQPAHPVELVLWGPFPTTIGDIIGETVGVVRDPEFAIGIQTLNPKTLGGYPTHENDIELGHTADDSGDYPNLPAELKKGQGFRGDTAVHTEFGSVLQAFCRNRDRARIISNWGQDKYVAPPFHDGGVIGSKIALFACPSPKALETIGSIELAEGLPHPMLDGVWGKVAPNATCSYLIVDFGEDTIDRAIEMARRAGVKYIYNGSPFETWGHFELKRGLFPHGWDGLRTCVDKARQAGVRVGFHTLSNFITPNDPYVTPVPDPRLARIGSSVLSSGIDGSTIDIPIAALDFFRELTDLDTVVIGEELVKYNSVSTEAPWRLLHCQRGAYGTKAAAHSAGASVGKLMDQSYHVFLTDADLAQEVARHIADLCNQTGAMQLSFDGLEGNWSTGYGEYGRTLFTTAWYDALSPDLRGRIINDASNPGHFNWHIYTRMNWGEPWGAGFRNGQTLYRFKNQLYFERNLMPHMLGWFALSAKTTREDAEWLLARAAGYDAGFALATSLASTAQLVADPASAEALQKYGALPAILEAIHQWETARLSGAFPENIKAALRDNTREFHLEPAGPGSWDLFPIVKLEPRTLGTAIRVRRRE